MGPHIILVIIALFAISCTETIQIKDFDKGAWNEDKMGCNGQRDQLSFAIFTHKQELFDTHPRAIKKLLGSPNKTQSELGHGSWDQSIQVSQAVGQTMTGWAGSWSRFVKLSGLVG